ncbi:MAG: endonuclease [Bacteroidaceae bacterium]|nr:endonuclease [Bacteroidaceae bacterium]
MKRILSLLLLLQLCAVQLFAQAEYYESIDGTKGGAALKTALYNLIKDHKQISYGSGSGSTWAAFYTTDAVIENGQRRVLDMYSSEKRYFGSKGSAVSGMNIEHSVAKSWWGGTKNNAYCDLHHLNPSDQTANSRKSNYPLGELTSVSWDNGVTFVGKANIDGSSENAYEPCDEYKGDFARVFMYMFTCYQDLSWEKTWMNYANSTYPTLKPWAVKLLLKWHKQDPVSEKEVNRNNAVYAVQGNRNPYVDYPQLADYVWGDSINYTFHINGEVEDGTGGSTGGGDTAIDVPDGYYLKLFENFEESTMNFTPVNTVGDFPWMFEYQCGEVTSYDDDGVAHNAESWLVSVPLDFTKDGSAELTFDYVIRYCADDKVQEHNQLLISRDYSGSIADATWEAIDFGAEQNSTDWTKTTVDAIVIPASYMGDKSVVIAFKYIGTEERAGTFEVDNIKLIAAEGENDGNTENENAGGGDDGGSTGGSEGNDGNFTAGSFTLVTDAAQLTVGDTIVIAYEEFAMGASAGNYRYKTDIQVSNNTITYLADDVQKVLLEEGAVEGTFALNVGDGYLAATSTSKNYVATVTVIDANASWAITIDSDALATVKAQGDKTRNTLQYNTSSPRFSCYTGSQKPVTIYAKSPVATGIGNVKGESGNVKTVFDLTGRRVNNAAAPGIYIVNGKKVLVK